MSLTLYRKYRPQKWAELVGQEHIKLILQKEIETDKLAHAYLFSGPRGLGKTTAARLVAKSLNCLTRTEGASEPCNTCANCEEIAAGSALDVIEMDAASHTGVDNVRENIVEAVRFTPAKSKNKIFIIDEAHMLSLSSFNALLKTLEEPPPHVIFILATTEAVKIPATIISRCQTFEFKKAPLAEIKKRLTEIAKAEGFSADPEVLHKVAVNSGGCLRDAESLLGQLLSLGAKNITLQEAELILPRSNFKEISRLIELLSAGELAPTLLHLNNLVEQGLDLGHFTNNLIETLRWLLHHKINADALKLNPELDETAVKRLADLAKNLTVDKIVKMIEILIKQKTAGRAAAIPQLPLELALVNICLDGQTADGVAATAAEKKQLQKAPSPLEGEGRVMVSLDFIKEKWQDYLNKVREYNHSLPFILKMSQPLEVNGQTVKISLKYSFHCEKLNEPKVRALAERALNDIYGCELRLDPVLIEEQPNAPSPVAAALGPLEARPLTGLVAASSGEGVGEGSASDNLVVNLAQAFGGQVVD